MDVQLQSTIPCVFGVLTTLTEAQAKDRSTGIVYIFSIYIRNVDPFLSPSLSIYIYYIYIYMHIHIYT